MKAQNFSFTKPKIKKESVEGGAILNYSEKGSAKWPPGLLNTIIPSSAFCNHSTNFFIWSRKTLLPLATCASLYHFNIASSLSTSAAISNQTFQSYYIHIMFVKQVHVLQFNRKQSLQILKFCYTRNAY